MAGLCYRLYRSPAERFGGQFTSPTGTFNRHGRACISSPCRKFWKNWCCLSVFWGAFRLKLEKSTFRLLYGSEQSPFCRTIATVSIPTLDKNYRSRVGFKSFTDFVLSGQIFAHPLHMHPPPLAKPLSPTSRRRCLRRFFKAGGSHL